MDQAIYKQIRGNQEMLYFLRKHPIWYRNLTRNPYMYKNFEEEVRIFYGKTVPQRIEKIKNNIQMIDMLVSLSKSMKD